MIVVVYYAIDNHADRTVELQAASYREPPDTELFLNLNADASSQSGFLQSRGYDGHFRQVRRSLSRVSPNYSFFNRFSASLISESCSLKNSANPSVT